MGNEFNAVDGPEQTFPDLELKTLDELKAAVGWEIRSTEGRLFIKARYNVLDALSIYAEHFGFTSDDLAQLLLSGNIVVRDVTDGKEYSGKRIADILGIVGPASKSAKNAGHARAVVVASPK